MPFGGKPEKTNSKVLEFEETAFREHSFSFPGENALPQERSIKLGGQRRKRYSKNNQEKEGPLFHSRLTAILLLLVRPRRPDSGIDTAPLGEEGKKQRAAPRIVVSSLPIFSPFPSSQELPSSAHRYRRAGRKRSDRARRKKGGLLLLLLRLQHTRVSTEAMAAVAAAAVFFLTAIKSL